MDDDGISVNGKLQFVYSQTSSSIRTRLPPKFEKRGKRARALEKSHRHKSHARIGAFR